MLRFRSFSVALVASSWVTLAAAQAPSPKPVAAAHDHDHAHDESPSEASTIANKPLTPEDEARRKQIVARAEGIAITIGDVEDHINAQSPLLRGRYRAPEELKKLLDNMIRFELLAAEATRRGYDKNSAVVRTLKDSTVQNLIRAEVDDKVTPQTVPSEEVKAYYDAHAEEFHRAAMRRASHVLVDSEDEAKALITQAKTADLRKFAELAKQQSKDIETKLRGGDLGYFGEKPLDASSESKVHEALRKAAFALKDIGDTSAKPVPVDGHFSVIRLTGVRPEQHTTLEEAEPSIRTRLWREKRQKALTDLVEGLRTKEKPVVKTDLVDLVKLEDMDKGPSGFTPDPPRANGQKAAE